MKIIVTGGAGFIGSCFVRLALQNPSVEIVNIDKLTYAGNLENKALPVYGDGMQIRDWLYVEDHCRALVAVLEKGRDGEIYNIGGNCSLPNKSVVERILAITGKPASLIEYVIDHPGHDRRYALSSAKLFWETGWSPQMDFEGGLAATVEWYRSNPEWMQHVRSGEYQSYYARNYEHRNRELSGIASGEGNRAGAKF